ncbi:MAG: hypothetical protein ACJ8AW_26080 [Rhodopila sp.]
MPARLVLEPNVRDVLLEQVQDENAALHAENGRLRAENEHLRSEGSAKDAEIERQRAEIAALRARARDLPVLPPGVQGGTAAGDGTGIPLRRKPAGDGGASAAVPRRVV